jgi:sugar lactone lactonase YvrE
LLFSRDILTIFLSYFDAATDLFLLFQFGNYAPKAGKFSIPNSIAVGPYGTVYVLDGAAGQVHQVRPDGGGADVDRQPQRRTRLRPSRRGTA